MPSSPPDLSGSKSSKSSSFHSSYHSDDHNIHGEAGHFEDIGLEDDARNDMVSAGPFKSSVYSFDAAFAQHQRPNAMMPRKQRSTPLPQPVPMQRDLVAPKGRAQLPKVRARVNTTSGNSPGLLPLYNVPPATRRGFTSPASHFSPLSSRNRSVSPRATSPNLPVDPRTMSTPSLIPRRSSWQANRAKKSAEDLEKECDDDDGDDVPDECFLENIPISPRPFQERATSLPPSASTSPERPPKEKIKTVGNGTSPLPTEQGELRSPRSAIHRIASMGDFPISPHTFPKSRAKSWTAALSELNEESKALTEALEAHADDEEKKSEQSRNRGFSHTGRPSEKGLRVRSAIAELPPLRRTDIMIDPLPISKEKEAVLSRTRPSWLPPKDPAEEKRHLKEYQRMMAFSLEAERKREANDKVKVVSRDDTAGALLRIWEEHILPNWDEVTRQKRTRELWWRGISSRSRGAVWSRAIGNELGLSETSYLAALRRAQALETTISRGSQLSPDEERKQGWLRAIDADVKTTYPELKIFQSAGPLHEPLLNVLKAYAMYRSDVGYVSGSSTIAAILLLNLPSAAASFQALSNILNRPVPLAFHTNDSAAMYKTYYLLLSTLEHKSPRLHSFLTNPRTGPEPAEYLRSLFTSLFTGSLNLDQATRLWDIMVFEGDAALVRAGVTYLLALEAKFYGASSPLQTCEIVEAGLGNMNEDDWVKALKAVGKS